MSEAPTVKAIAKKSPFLSAHLLNQSQPKSAAALEALKTPWQELTFIGFDTETTGKYPLDAEICEIGAVKWRGGKIIDVFETLLRPTKPMGSEVIAIHGITNEMVEKAPQMSAKIGEFYQFMQGAIPIAHHAPFDLGFLGLEFEKAGLQLPDLPVMCSSLMSRKTFPESENHRLQTLIRFFQLEQGAAHRAHDDARACLDVGLKCLEKIGVGTLDQALCVQGGPLFWSRFSMQEIRSEAMGKSLIQAIEEQKVIEMAYASGSTPGEKRRVHPQGLVRSLDGDFLVGYAEKDMRSKRYFLDQITSVEIVA